ncbi:MAG TPA: cytochrome c [Gemmatimonadaceae bacterium]|nr:cytochrome c [Gemmatimonadaceae bacterium]
MSASSPWSARRVVPGSAARDGRKRAVTGALATAHAAFAGTIPTRCRRLASRALLLALIPLGGCEWFSDFKKQPVIYPWDSRDTLTASRGNPQGSVTTSGTRVSGFEISYSPLPSTVDSMSGLSNPTPAAPASLANGRMYYQINCAVCHGDRGMGDGTATKFGMPGINIAGDGTRARSDGYIYGMIRNGRGLMPTYNRIEEMDRWDVVNYLRALQSGGAVQVGPLAAPGVTGDKVPGPTRRGPTRPSPYFNSPAARSAAPAAIRADSARRAAPADSAAGARDTAAAGVHR